MTTTHASQMIGQWRFMLRDRFAIANTNKSLSNLNDTMPVDLLRCGQREQMSRRAYFSSYGIAMSQPMAQHCLLSKRLTSSCCVHPASCDSRGRYFGVFILCGGARLVGLFGNEGQGAHHAFFM